MTLSRIALVGHCAFDSASLTRLAQQLAPQAQVLRINDQSALDQVASQGTLLLVNRVLDGHFSAGESGVDLIRALAQREHVPMMMLVSNYAHAQEQAVQAGALPGFGKSDMGNVQKMERLIAALEA